jgi:hypothetical protein
MRLPSRIASSILIQLWIIVRIVVHECGVNVSCSLMNERISIPELEKRLKGGKLVLVDVRDASEIKESGAIPGAIHIPMAEVQKRLGELPKDAEIVFY